MSALSSRHLVIRADASKEIGGGHVMRTAALAEAWMESDCGPVSFVGDITLPVVARYVSDLGAPVEPSARSVSPDSVVVVDHYSDAVRAQMAEVNCALRVLVDDVGGRVGNEFDVIWRPAPSPRAKLYPAFQGTVLTGLEFLSIRSRLPRWSPSPASGVAVMLGAGSPPGWLREALSRLPDDVDGERFAGVEGVVPDDWDIIDANDPWAGIVTRRSLVTAAGSTMWEAARVGIPVVVLCVAENQRLNFEWACGQGVPSLDALALAGEPALLAQRVIELLPHARLLPPVENGTGRVRDALLALLDEED